MENNQKATVITMSLGVSAPLLLVKKMTCHEAENFFVKRRDAVKNSMQKQELDRARAFVKFAACCNAMLLEMRQSGGFLKITLCFEKLEDMVFFANNVSSSVASATGT